MQHTTAVVFIHIENYNDVFLKARNRNHYKKLNLILQSWMLSYSWYPRFTFLSWNNFLNISKINNYTYLLCLRLVCKCTRSYTSDWTRECGKMLLLLVFVFILFFANMNCIHEEEAYIYWKDKQEQL